MSAAAEHAEYLAAPVSRFYVAVWSHIYLREVPERPDCIFCLQFVYNLLVTIPNSIVIKPTLDEELETLRKARTVSEYSPSFHILCGSTTTRSHPRFFSTGIPISTPHYINSTCTRHRSTAALYSCLHYMSPRAHIAALRHERANI